MKNIFLIINLLVFVGASFCQKNNIEIKQNPTSISMGAMPVLFIAVGEGPGPGVELNTKYSINKQVGFGLFGRAKSTLSSTSTKIQNGDTIKMDSEAIKLFAAGLVIDLKLVKFINLELRGGYEAVVDPAEEQVLSRYIFGGGLIFNMMRTNYPLLSHSLRFMVDLESDRKFDAIIPGFSDFIYSNEFNIKNTRFYFFSFQVGWNIQLSFIKKRELNTTLN